MKQESQEGKSQPFFRWGRTGAEHRDHSVHANFAPSDYETGLFDHHLRKTGHRPSAVCRHSGFLGYRYYCCTCGGEVWYWL